MDRPRLSPGGSASLQYYMGNKDSLTVPGRYDAIRDICKFVSRGAEYAGFDEDTIFHLELACDEACTNIIEHTYKEEGTGDITISWEIRNKSFVVTIKDSGKPFDPAEIPAPPSVPPVAASDAEDEHDIKVGGLGVYFMRKLMDRVTFFYKEGSGNVLTMEKQLPGKKAK